MKQAKINLHIEPKTYRLVQKIGEAISQNGGRSFFVGGLVRDILMGVPSKDVDIEVYSISFSRLKTILASIGKVNFVGQSFGVLKLGEIDISLPRRDNKVGIGHTGFDVNTDPNMSFYEACRRRDITINSILMDTLSGEIIDPFDGERDIQQKIIRVTDPDTFAEDPLRVLRVVQFAARFGFSVEDETTQLCRKLSLSELPRERIYTELEKLLLKAERPSIGLRLFEPLGLMKYFPEIAALKGVRQNPRFHPEGDVFEHTLLVVDAAATMRDTLPPKKQVALMFAALCHDFGKPETSEGSNDKITCHGHDIQGAKPTEKFMEQISNERKLIDEIISLVICHMRPLRLYQTREQIGPGAVRRLAGKTDIPLLAKLTKADHIGKLRPAEACQAADWLLEKAQELGVTNGAPKRILLGRHLIKDLQQKPGPHFKVVLDSIYEMQLDGEVNTLDEALEKAKEILEGLAK